MFGEFKSNCKERALDLDMTKVCMYVYILPAKSVDRQQWQLHGHDWRRMILASYSSVALHCVA
jgi:hypothetical protein